MGGDKISDTGEAVPADTVRSSAGALALAESTLLESEIGDRQVVTDRRQFGRELADRGFTTVTSARGPWIEERDGAARVGQELAFGGHPDGSLVTVTRYKMMTSTGSGSSLPYATARDAESYAAHVREWRLNVSEEAPITAFTEPDA